ncbi:IS630-Spn1, transposase [Wolbachia endosymbiont of Armadillidium vulgare str. wVulC]|nr:IS630-Spn1, transposase [Wolbachia endosymbiont of Armadillidium vulgare str. wVulC]
MKEKVEPKRFKIGKTTLYEWQKRHKETGDFQSKKPGSVDKITDWNVFTKFAKNHGGKTQSEMLGQYQSTNEHLKILDLQDLQI